MLSYSHGVNSGPHELKKVDIRIRATAGEPKDCPVHWATGPWNRCSHLGDCPALRPESMAEAGERAGLLLMMLMLSRIVIRFTCRLCVNSKEWPRNRSDLTAEQYLLWRDNPGQQTRPRASLRDYGANQKPHPRKASIPSV
jgi:hypothetical protein